MGFTETVATDESAPISYRLVSWAIRFAANRVTGSQRSIQMRWLFTNPLSRLTGAVMTHAEQRFTSNGFASFKM
jgi:hypothetical protein